MSEDAIIELAKALTFNSTLRQFHLRNTFVVVNNKDQLLELLHMNYTLEKLEMQLLVHFPSFDSPKKVTLIISSNQKGFGMQNGFDCLGEKKFILEATKKICEDKSSLV